jgi:hypothetical protein
MVAGKLLQRRVTESFDRHTPHCRSTQIEARFIDDSLFVGTTRCDLSPRWNRAGNALCIDAIDGEGTRQLHVVNVPHEK